MVRLLLAVVLMAGVCRALANGRGFPLIDTFSTVQVGADVVGLAAAQDADGVMYFGSNSLLVFDGDRWHSEPIAGTYGLYALDFGADGKLWAGAVGELGWFARESGTWRYHSLLDRLPAGERNVGSVFSAFAYKDGAIFATEDRLLYWNGHDIRTWKLPDTRKVRAFRAGDEIFVEHLLTGLYHFLDGSLKLLVPAEALGPRSIFWLERRETGFVLLANDGLHELADGTLRPIAGTAAPYIQKHHPTAAIMLPDRRLAVGTMEGGIAFVTLDGALESVLDPANGLESPYSVPLLVDRDGVLWAGSWKTISRVPIDAATTIYDRRAAFPLEPTLKIGRHDGRLLVSTPRQLYRLEDSERRFSPFTPDTAFLRDFHSVGGDLIAGGYRRVVRFGGSGGTVMRETNFDVYVMAPARGSPSQLYIADGLTIVKMSLDENAGLVAEGLPDYARSIAEDPTGTLWLGTKGYGLFAAPRSNRPTRVERVGPASGIVNPVGSAHAAALPDGTIVAFTAAGAWFQPAGTTRFEPVPGAPARVATATAIDASGTALWVTYRGDYRQPALIAHVALQAGSATWQPHAVDGLPNIGIPAAIFAESRASLGATLWIGGTEGVLRHEIPDTVLLPTPRAPLLRAMARIGHDRVESVGTRALPASTRSLDFKFALPEFGRRTALRLESRIDDVDADWVPVARGAGRELNQIRPGHYTVRARAVAESGVTSRETVLAFEVLKPWWQTSPARAGMVLLAGLAVFGGFRVRVRRLRSRNAELETKVQQRTEELQRASAAKTEFVANMSHDIRNPLNGIVGLAYALEDSRLDERQRDLVATLRECTSYLSTLVDDVLDFARIEAGRVELRPGPFNASELLGSIATMLKSDTIQSGATLVVECDPALPPHLLGDAGRIQQILVNYVSNALKYAGGTIRLSATLPAGAPDEVEFAVTDFGAGLTADEQAILFTKFTRTAQARQHAVPGTGLGLAACRLLADIMGGSVGVISEPGKGATFFLRLPLVVGTQRPTEPARALPNATVLLVEDTEYNAAAATAVLQRLGLRCERARTGEEAIRLFGEKRYNVVLLDRNLPDMDGTEVARQIRALEGEGIRSILLAVTAYCTPEDRTRCIEAGMDAFVGKPLTPEKLRKVLLAAGRPMRATSTLAMHEPPPAPDAAPVAIKGLDTTLLSYLAEGSANGLMEQIARYVANLERTQRELLQLLATRDGEALANTAHRLLGDARMVNATPLAAAVSALEIAARNGQLADCPARLELVMTEIARVTEALYRQRAAPTA